MCFYEAADGRQEEALKVTLSFYGWRGESVQALKEEGPHCTWVLGGDLTLSLLSFHSAVLRGSVLPSRLQELLQPW